MTLRVNELGIDSVKFWEIIEALENELDVEYEIEEIVDGASNFIDLEKITERKLR
jgi:acyl carrier protein